MLRPRDREYAFTQLGGPSGLPYPAIQRLLRLGAGLHRDAEAQCNGTWPYPHPDRPGTTGQCSACDNEVYTPCLKRLVPRVGPLLCPSCRLRAHAEEAIGPYADTIAPCLTCNGQGWYRDTTVTPSETHNCPECLGLRHRVVTARFALSFGGDPRGAVLRVLRPGDRRGAMYSAGVVCG